MRKQHRKNRSREAESSRSAAIVDENSTKRESRRIEQLRVAKNRQKKKAKRTCKN